MCTTEVLNELDTGIEMIRLDLTLFEGGNFTVSSYGADVTKDIISRMTDVLRRLEWIAQSHRASDACPP